MTHLYVSKLTSIGSDNGLSPGRRQAIIWTNAGILLIGNLWTNFSEILIEIQTFSLKKMRLKVSSAKRRPFCLGLNVLTLLSWCGMDMMLFVVTGQESRKREICVNAKRSVLIKRSFINNSVCIGGLVGWVLLFHEEEFQLCTISACK